MPCNAECVAYREIGQILCLLLYFFRGTQVGCREMFGGSEVAPRDIFVGMVGDMWRLLRSFLRCYFVHFLFKPWIFQMQFERNTKKWCLRGVWELLGADVKYSKLIFGQAGLGKSRAPCATPEAFRVHFCVCL